MKVFQIVLLASILVASASAQHPIQVKIENEVVAFDAPPREVRGVTMVPIRSMLEGMGGTMRWDLATRTLTGWKNSRRFDVVLNSRSANLNDRTVTMEEAPLIHRNRIYVPLKFIADAAGYTVSVENGWYVLRPMQR
jgi:hypothetical protein